MLLQRLTVPRDERVPGWFAIVSARDHDEIPVTDRTIVSATLG